MLLSTVVMDNISFVSRGLLVGYNIGFDEIMINNNMKVGMNHYFYILSEIRHCDKLCIYRENKN